MLLVGSFVSHTGITHQICQLAAENGARDWSTLVLLQPWKRTSYLERKDIIRFPFPVVDEETFTWGRKEKCSFCQRHPERKKVYEVFSGMWLLLGFSQLSCFQKHWNVVSAIIVEQKRGQWVYSVVQKNWVKTHTLWLRCQRKQI